MLSHHARPLFRVRRRRFALFNGESSPPAKRWRGWGRSLHFLSEIDDREGLASDKRLRPSPHHRHRGWLAIDLDDRTDCAELAEFIDAAYRQAAPAALVMPTRPPSR